jgi:hypothetical protein
VTPAPAPPSRSASPVGGSFGLAGPRPTTTPTLGLPRPTPTPVSTPATPAAPGTPAPPLPARGTPGPSERTTPTPGLARPSLPTLPSLPTVPRLSLASPTRPAAPSRAVAPAGRTTCPDTHPIKGVITPTDRVYLTRTSPAYPAAAPTQCFATEADARLAGFRRVDG